MRLVLIYILKKNYMEAEDAKEKYAIPSAFAAYAKYMNILLGNKKKA